MSTGFSTFYPVLPILFILAIVLLLLPVPGFVRTRNASVLFYVAWLMLGNAIYGLNMFLWRGNTANRSPVYCDIRMLPIGIACSLLCINRLVWNISRYSTLLLTNNPRRNKVDTLICVGIPLTFGALRILVQDNRFTIVQDIGCFPSVDHTLPALLIYYLPPSLICCCITSIYSALSIINFCKNRPKTSSLSPNEARTAMTPNRFLRLTLLCITSFVFSALFLLSMLVKNIQIGLHSWTTWTASNWNFGEVQVVSRADLDASFHKRQLFVFRLLFLPILSIHFFLFFGFGSEAVRQYRASLNWLQRLPRRFVRHERKQSDLTPATEELEELPRGPIISSFRMSMVKKRGPAWIHTAPPPVRVWPTNESPIEAGGSGNAPPFRTPAPLLPTRPAPTSPPPPPSPRRTSTWTPSQFRLSLNNSNLRRLSSLMYRHTATPVAGRRNSVDRELQPPISPVYLIPSPVHAEAAVSPNRSSTSSVGVSLGHFPFPPSPRFPNATLPLPSSLRFSSINVSTPAASTVKVPAVIPESGYTAGSPEADETKGFLSPGYLGSVPTFYSQYQTPLPQRRSPYEESTATLSSRHVLRIDANAANALPSGHSGVGFLAATTKKPSEAVARSTIGSLTQIVELEQDAESCFSDAGSTHEGRMSRESGYFSLGGRDSSCCVIPELPPPLAVPMEPPSIPTTATASTTTTTTIPMMSLVEGGFGLVRHESMGENTASTRSRFSVYSDRSMGDNSSPARTPIRSPIRSARDTTTRMFSWAAKRVGNGSQSI